MQKPPPNTKTYSYSIAAGHTKSRRIHSIDGHKHNIYLYVYVYIHIYISVCELFCPPYEFHQRCCDSKRVNGGNVFSVPQQVEFYTFDANGHKSVLNSNVAHFSVSSFRFFFHRLSVPNSHSHIITISFIVLKTTPICV